MHSAEDFLLVLRQQLLVGMRRVQPLAAGTIPTREESSAAAGRAAGTTASTRSAAAVDVPAAAQAILALAAGDYLDPVETGATQPGGPGTGVELEAAVAGEAPLKLIGISTSSSEMKAVPAASSSSSTSCSSKNAAVEPVLRRPEYFSAADMAAAAVGGWRGFMLCWWGFQGQGVDHAVLVGFPGAGGGVTVPPVQG